MNQPRRVFIIQSAAVCGALASTHVLAQTTMASVDMVKDSDAPATAVGYVSDATKADKTKYATYAAGQRCGTCILFEGKGMDKAGGCPLFPSKQVAAAGWCSSWAKKA